MIFLWPFKQFKPSVPCSCLQSSTSHHQFETLFKKTTCVLIQFIGLLYILNISSWSIKTFEGFFEQAKRKSNWIQNQIILNLISLYFLAASKGSSSFSFFLWWNSELSTQATEANTTEVSQPEELEDQPAWLHMYTYHAWWSIKNKPFLLHSVPSRPDNALWALWLLFFHSHSSTVRMFPDVSSVSLICTTHLSEQYDTEVDCPMIWSRRLKHRRANKSQQKSWTKMHRK